MIRPQLSHACLWYQLCHRSQHEVFSGRASAVFWLILSFLDQDWPVAFVYSISQACILAGYPPVQSHTTASCWKHRGLHLHSCAWNAQQFAEGWERSASKKHKMWLWSGLFYWLFLPHLKNLQRFFSLLWKLSNPHSLHAARLTAVCVMASHSSWHALCPLAIGNALNTEFSLTFILRFPEVVNVFGFFSIYLFHVYCSLTHLKIWNLKANGTQNIRRYTIHASFFSPRF